MNITVHQKGLLVSFLISTVMNASAGLVDSQDHTPRILCHRLFCHFDVIDKPFQFSFDECSAIFGLCFGVLSPSNHSASQSSTSFAPPNLNLVYVAVSGSPRFVNTVMAEVCQLSYSTPRYITRESRRSLSSFPGYNE